MTRALAVILALLSAQPVYAACTWSTVALAAPDYRGSVTTSAVCTLGTEAAPTLATQGMPLEHVGSYLVIIEATTAAQTVADGALRAYFYDPVAAAWIRVPDLDLTVPATGVRGYTFLGSSPGLGQPVLLRTGRVAYVPDGVTKPAGNITVTLLAAGTRGERL